jgi:hypothetical protein
MKRLVSILASAFLAVLILGSAVIWERYFRTPPIERLPLPNHLVALESPAGQELLAESDFIADYEGLAANFVSQSRPAFCGVASTVVALNALRGSGPRLNQSTFFTRPRTEVRDSFRVSFTGMSLRQLGDALRAHGAEAAVVYASDSNLDAFRSIAKNNLSSSADVLLVNYQRAELGQSESGHISPLAAYHAATDRVLILDVAAYKYPPVWVSTAALWSAMNAPLNSSTNRTRGFIVVRDGKLQGMPGSAVQDSEVRLP